MKNKILILLLAAFSLALATSCYNWNNGQGRPTDFSGGAEAVDLGLSVKWASFNVGAKNVDGYGSYFAWGETQEKLYYSMNNPGEYKWGTWAYNPKSGMTKYTADREGGDGLKTLQAEDDPATANWGTKWRTPTFDEILELLDEKKCAWKWDAIRRGFTVTGLSTGNSIFLPSPGRRETSNHWCSGSEGWYWSSSVREEMPCNAWMLVFSMDSPEGGTWDNLDRGHGISVRAVTDY